ncbi:MAG TPA: polymer-forming cytoskeletal protein [Candidatus Acidoferrales bacterium]|jgi:cytoskeletal protein CcmA (bactofilin family)|nr:polymer-forming cytoskeletal protein [Candidatus Acidoferrales bacterium]
MWHKNDGKASPEVPQPTAGSTPKSQVTTETSATSTVSPALAASDPAPAPRTAWSEAPATISSTTPPPSAGGTSKIQSGLKIHGEISGTSDLYLDCELQGKLRLGSARLVIGPNGKVQADIDAGSITIEGSVHGNIKSTESVHLGAGSRVEGSILTPRIGIDDGARLRGKVEMIKPGVSASIPTATPATASSAPATRSTTGTEAPRAIAASAKSE